jgi:hypothetical protein
VWLGVGSEATSHCDCVADVARATQESLESPAGFPPLAQATVPGDRVAIALGEGVRQAAEVVRGVVAALERAGTGRESVTVMAGTIDEANQLRAQLDDLVAGGCTVVGHVSSDDEELCYLAAVDDAALLISRQLFEADVVIPVGCGRPAGVRDARGPYEAVYPRYSDRLTQQRYAQADALDSPVAGTHRRRETEKAGWLLGAALVVQVVPSRGGGVAEVVAGDPEAVSHLVETSCQETWSCQIAEPAKLVVATLVGDRNEQTWENVARALHAAGRIADQDASAVALCTDMDCPPGEALQLLMTMGGDLDRAAKLANVQTHDAAAAWEIYKALCRGPVYFMSRLDAETVEELGMTPIANRDELTRLAQRSASCAVLNEGQHSIATFAD